MKRVKKLAVGHNHVNRAIGAGDPPLVILNALEGRSLPIYGDGGNVRDWLHVDDHCRGLLLVLERGRLVEQGTHDELLARGGAYADLYQSQFAEPLAEAV